MSQSIDLTGLSPEAVRVVESLVGLLRQNAAKANGSKRSVFDLFGKAPTLRTAEDIAAQVREERDAWGEP
jgi:hypothetical protein